MVSVKNKEAFVQTTEDFASRSSIHGVGYVFDRNLGPVDRILWVFVVLAFLCLAGFLTINIWTQWREEQVRVFFLLMSYRVIFLTAPHHQFQYQKENRQAANHGFLFGTEYHPVDWL